MALAYIRYEESAAGKRRFRIDLGRNRYYAYAIGDAQTLDRHGVALLRDPVYESEILGPLPEDELGRGELEVPESQFGRVGRFIQLRSFRTRRGIGPAVSEVLETEPGSAEELESESRRPLERSAAMTLVAQSRSYSLPRPVRRNAHVRENAPLSTAQFIDAIVSLLPQLLPAAGGLVGAITGAAAGGAAVPTAAGGAPPWLGQLMQLVQQLLAQTGAGARAGPSGPPVVSAPIRGHSVATAQSQYSEAMVLPLLAALPALMPLLQQVLTPQTIQGILQTADPNRLIGTVSNAINSFAQLGLQNAEAERAHLRALNPGVDDPALMALLGQMSTQLERVSKSAPLYKRTDKVRLHFAESTTVNIGGRQVMAYLHGRDLQFPIALETPKPVPAGWMQATIQHAETLEAITRMRLKTPPLGEGRAAIVPSFAADRLTSLKPGHDYLVKVELLWKGKSGQKIGTCMTQTVRVLGEYTFDSVQEGKEVVPLNDVDKYRDFWHKIWQDSFSKEVARREYECKYYYALRPELTENQQARSRLIESEEGVRKVKGRLSAGLLVSPNRLNELLKDISSEQPLSEAELKALLDPRFIERTNLAARYHAKFGGPPERPAALWTFPEVKVQRITLRQADKVEDSGHVVSTVDREVRFPVPVLVHFVGVAGE